jgi:MYXO-CTERM domain-containing protein
MTKLRQLAMAATLAFGAAYASTASAELIVNGGFETGDLTGWTVYDASGFTFVSVVPFNESGVYGAALGPYGDQGYLSQTFATTPGAGYELHFGLANFGGDPPNNFYVSFGNTDLGGVADIGSFYWIDITIPVYADSASTTLTFSFRNDSSYFALDNVSVTPAPELSTWALMLAGFGGLGLLAARRRAALSKA